MIYCTASTLVLLKHEMLAALESWFLQVREKPKGEPAFQRPARGLTKPEFHDKMTRLVKRVHDLADEKGLEGPWYFVFDNPSIHNIEPQDVPTLGPGDELLYAARYAPELMQAIEHSHGYTCEEFLKERMVHGMTHWDIQAEWKLLQEVFVRVNTPEVVRKTVARVQPAAQQIIIAKGGRIPKKYR